MHKRIKVLQNISNGPKDNRLCSHWTGRIFRRHGHEQPFFFFFEKEEKYINGNVRPEGQIEQHEIWQEEQTPSKPLAEMNV